MNISHALSPLLAVISGGLLSGTALSDNIMLPPPDKKGGRPLMQVLNERHSTRSFADKPIPMEILSSLLWAAQGVNRDDPDYRTAPSSRNSNEIEIYAVLPQGAYLYKPETHQLERVVQGDMRAATGTQEFAATAPLNLVYVVDQSKQPGDFDAKRKLVTACTGVGFIGENVYLFCTAPRPLACAETLMDTPAPLKVKDARNCYRLSPELYRSGQPGGDGFKALEKLGLKSVLNLREYHSDADEAEHTGLRLYRIKLAAGKVTREELMDCLLVISRAPKPVLVHCWHGSDRTGIVCAAYRIVMQGWTPEKALEELMDERFGHHRSYYSNLAELVRDTDWKAFKEEFRRKRQAQGV